MDRVRVGSAEYLPTAGSGNNAICWTGIGGKSCDEVMTSCLVLYLKVLQYADHEFEWGVSELAQLVCAVFTDI